MERSNGNRVASACTAVDYSLMVHDGVTQDGSEESAHAEPERAGQDESRPPQAQALSTALHRLRTDTVTGTGAAEIQADVTLLRREVAEALTALHTATTGPVAASWSRESRLEQSLIAVTEALQQSTERLERLMEIHQQTLRTAIELIRDDMRSALAELNRESLDSFEQRQGQLRMDQMEMERNLARLRQELITTQSESGSKKRLWR